MKRSRRQGCVHSDGCDRWQAAENRSGEKKQKTGTEMILLLPAITPVSLLSGSMHRGGFVSILGLRIVVQDVVASFSYALLRQPYLRPRRCGDFGLVSRHKPAEHHFLMFPLFPTLRRRVSHAEERLRYQRFFYMQGCGCVINASHTQGCGCEINGSLTIRRRQHVMARPRASRSSSYCASGGRGVGFDMACCNVLQQSGSFGGHARG